MPETTARPPSIIAWAVADLPIPGETVSGDAAVVETWPGGALVAALDALGHGPEAEHAARIAAQVLRKRAADPISRLVEECHEALRRTRGIALSLASFAAREDRLTWLGIGNVEAVLFRSNPHSLPRRESALLRGGIVGGQLPAVRATTAALGIGDTLVMASDGVSSRFAIESFSHEAPQELADRILAKHGKGTDDALVVVARYLGDEG